MTPDRLHSIGAAETPERVPSAATSSPERNSATRRAQISVGSVVRGGDGEHSLAEIFTDMPFMRVAHKLAEVGDDVSAPMAATARHGRP